LLSIFLPAPILARLPRVYRRWTVHFGGVAMWCYRPGVVWWFHRMRSSQQHWTVCSRNSLMMSTVAVESIASLRADPEIVERFRHSLGRIPFTSTCCLGAMFHVKPSWICTFTLRAAVRSWPHIRGGGGGGGGGVEDQAQNKTGTAPAPYPALVIRETSTAETRLLPDYHVSRETRVLCGSRKPAVKVRAKLLNFPAPPRARCPTPAFPQRPANEDTARI